MASVAQIVDFGNAAKHLETCKTQLRQVVQQLTPPEEPWIEDRELE